MVVNNASPAISGSSLRTTYEPSPRQLKRYEVLIGGAQKKWLMPHFEALLLFQPTLASNITHGGKYLASINMRRRNRSKRPLRSYRVTVIPIATPVQTISLSPLSGLMRKEWQHSITLQRPPEPD